LQPSANHSVAIFPKKSDDSDGCWRWGLSTVEENINDVKAFRVEGKEKWNVSYRVYLEKNGQLRVAKPKSVWQGPQYSTDAATKTFKSLIPDISDMAPKPIDLLKDIAMQSMEEDDIALDFFAGSSTTALAVMQLNAEDASTGSAQAGQRRFIMVQIPEPTPEDSEARKAGFKTIADISRKRIELAGEKIKQDIGFLAQPLDTGFRAYKLTDTHFAKWRVSSDIEPNQLEQHLLDLRNSANDAANSDDLLTEILIKLGFSLTTEIATQTIAGLEVRKIDGNLALAYVNERVKPTLEQLRALVEASPMRLIVLEDAFQGDDELKTNLAQCARAKNIELWTA
ncbi:DNA methyltransferase, partial [Leptospira sp. SA-E8]|uniref:DNA methyltransferase n=1 Tax=Leptospira sp. SA-E8 TaxID=3422259 RepID=UPI003EBD8F94